MRICYTIDERSLVIPVCDWTEDIVMEEGWYDGVIDGNAYVNSVPRYKQVNGAPVLRSDAEIQADIDAIPLPDPTDIEQLQADVDFLTMENESLEEQNEQQQADIDFLLMMMEGE